MVWAALQCFITLVRVTNRAWGDEAYNWWRLPLRGMALLGVTAGAVLLGMAAPALASVGKSWFFPANDVGGWVYALWGFVVPLLVLFLSLTLFYRLAPRRTTRFAEVWVAAACVFGGIMALLLWIYLSGCGFIFGACLCAAQVLDVGPLVGEILVETETRPSPVAVAELHLFYNRATPRKGSGSIYAPVTQRLLPLDEGWRRKLLEVPWPTARLPEVLGGTPRLYAHSSANISSSRSSGRAPNLSRARTQAGCWRCNAATRTSTTCSKSSTGVSTDCDRAASTRRCST